MIIEVNSSDFDKEISNGIVLVDFNASWCGPCRMLKPILESIVNETSYKILSVNVDDEEFIAEKYGITSIPCLIFFKDGKEVKRSIGLKSKEEILNMLGEI